MIIMNFIIIFISSSDPNLLRRKSVKQKIKKRWPNLVVNPEYTFSHDKDNMSLVMRKPDFCICKNKDADQLRGNREADHRLSFGYMESTIPLLPKSKISSLWPSSVVVQPGLCLTWSETPNTGFLTKRLICP